jgi:hypothetical protein
LSVLIAQLCTALSNEQVAARERGQREEEDRREKGRETLRAAAERHAAAFEAAIAIGVQVLLS